LKKEQDGQDSATADHIALSQRTRFVEYVAAVSADAVITHSPREAEALAKHIPAAKIHTVTWSTTPRPTPIPFLQRSGVAFIGSYGHAPNLDAAMADRRDHARCAKAQAGH